MHPATQCGHQIRNGKCVAWCSSHRARVGSHGSRTFSGRRASSAPSASSGDTPTPAGAGPASASSLTGAYTTSPIGVRHARRLGIALRHRR